MVDFVIEVYEFLVDVTPGSFLETALKPFFDLLIELLQNGAA